jgi:hypothetical protein
MNGEFVLYPPKSVEILCTTRAKAVENRTTKDFLRRDPSNPQPGRMGTAPSRVASLDRTVLPNTIVPALTSNQIAPT